jgi:hypothetical protein
MVFEGEDTEATDIAGLSFVVFMPILALAIPWEILDLVVVAVQGAPQKAFDQGYTMQKVLHNSNHKQWRYDQFKLGTH